MKALIFLCLLSFMICEKDIIDIGKCIYKAPKVQELVKDVMVAIMTKDYSKLLPKIKEALPELIKIILGCIIDTNAIEEQPKLTFFDFKSIFCGKFCGNFPPEASEKCISQCMSQ